jgi:ParB family chromosome partitioning protein
MDEFHHTQEDLSRAIGKSRSHIANLLRLLVLPEDVRELLRENKLSMGHARALIGMENASEVAHKIVKSGMSVRQVERLAQAQARHPERLEKPASLAGPRDADTTVLERELTQLLGLRVQIVINGQGGILSVHYQTLEQLDDVLRRLNNLPPLRGE